MKVPFYRHALGRPDAAQVADVLASPYLTAGDVGRKVEDKLADFFGVNHAVLTSSWTNGAYATLMALDIGPGDEVIVPAMSFIASANVAELVGARPVFVDIDPTTLLITPEAVAAALSARTKAVIPVHLYGQMCDMAAIRRVLDGRPDVALLEDCAHCFEGQRDGDRPGSHSDAAIFSFYATKNVTCGEGGAVVTKRCDLYEALLRIRSHGMSAPAVDRFTAGAYRHWDMECLGLKATLPDILAALLGPQIDTVYHRLAEREDIARRYESAVADLPIRVVQAVPDALHARHLFPIHVRPQIRDRVMLGLNRAGVGTTVNYRAVPTTKYYRTKYGYRPGDYPVAEDWGDGTISLPLFPSLSRSQQDYVIERLASPSLVDGEDQTTAKSWSMSNVKEAATRRGASP